MTVSSSSTSSSVHLYVSAYFFLTFSEDLDMFLSDKLQASTLYTMQYYVVEEMTPKSQLCACSFHDSLQQKNWALEQIRKFPDTIGHVWTIRIRCVWTRKFSHPQKNICGKKISGYVWTWPNFHGRLLSIRVFSADGHYALIVSLHYRVT